MCICALFFFYFFLNYIKPHLLGLAGIETVDEVVTCNVYQLVINFNVAKRYAQEVVTCNVDQWIIESDEGSDVKIMTIASHSRKTTTKTNGTMKELSGNWSG